VGLWKSILRALGLSSDATVRISTPDIEVTLSGDPEKVRLLLGVVRYELEKNPRFLVRATPMPKRGRRAAISQVVQPTELDEMDSPYALPEAVVLPVPDEAVTDQRRLVRLTAVPAPSAVRDDEVTADPDAMLPPIFGDVPSEDTMGDGPDSETTAVAPNPSGAIPAVSRSRPFVTDGGPTLMPTDSQTTAAPSRKAGGRSSSSNG